MLLARYFGACITSRLIYAGASFPTISQLKTLSNKMQKNSFTLQQSGETQIGLYLKGKAGEFPTSLAYAFLLVCWEFHSGEAFILPHFSENLV